MIKLHKSENSRVVCTKGTLSIQLQSAVESACRWIKGEKLLTGGFSCCRALQFFNGLEQCGRNSEELELEPCGAFVLFPKRGWLQLQLPLLWPRCHAQLSVAGLVCAVRFRSGIGCILNVIIIAFAWISDDLIAEGLYGLVNVCPPLVCSCRVKLQDSLWTRVKLTWNRLGEGGRFHFTFFVFRIQLQPLKMRPPCTVRAVRKQCLLQLN